MMGADDHYKLYLTMLTLSALKLVSTINGREKLHCYSSQGGEGRKVHVFLSCRGQFHFMFILYIC